jgi:hypothetical protein
MCVRPLCMCELIHANGGGRAAAAAAQPSLVARHDGKMAQAQTEALFARLMGSEGGGGGGGGDARAVRRRDVHQVARDRAFR